MKNLVYLFVLLCTGIIAQEDDRISSDPVIGLNAPFSYKMLEANQNLRKVSLLLEERRAGALSESGLVIGSSLIALADFQHSNVDSKFGYLMRHPTTNNQIGNTVSEAVIHSFQLATTASINNWISAFVEILYNPEQSFGQGTITHLERNQLQLRKGFVVLGDLRKSPVYAAIGKMDASFGLTGSVSPFTNSSLWHAFGALAYGAQIGIKTPVVHATFMAAQGGSQFRALNTPVGDSTNVPSRLNNFVLDLNLSPVNTSALSLMVGGSYMHGSAYCQRFPVKHFEPCHERNPAITAYAQLEYQNKLLFKGAFAVTGKEWPGTNNPTPPLDIYKASKVSSLSLGLQYDLASKGKFQYTLSGEFSNFRAGPDEAPWERQNQMVLGLSAIYNASSKIFVEVFRTEGFTPLNFISGSLPFQPFPPGETHSENQVFSHGLVVGVQATL